MADPPSLFTKKRKELASLSSLRAQNAKVKNEEKSKKQLSPGPVAIGGGGGSKKRVERTETIHRARAVAKNASEKEAKGDKNLLPISVL